MIGEADPGVDRLALQEVLRIAERGRRLDDARAVDHHHAEAEQSDDGGREHDIDRPATLVVREQVLHGFHDITFASSASDGAAKVIAAVRVALEHVEARARRAREHRVARLRQPKRAARRRRPCDPRARRAARLRRPPRCASAASPITTTARPRSRQRLGERRVRPVLVAAAGDEHAARFAQAAQRRHGGADVRALRVVVEAHAAGARRTSAMRWGSGSNARERAPNGFGSHAERARGARSRRRRCRGCGGRAGAPTRDRSASPLLASVTMPPSTRVVARRRTSGCRPSPRIACSSQMASPNGTSADVAAALGSRRRCPWLRRTRRSSCSDRGDPR